MTFSRGLRVTSAALLFAACGETGGSSSSAGQTDGAGSSSSASGSSSTSPTSGVSDSATSEPGSGSDSMTSQTATEPTTTATTETSNSGSTTAPGTTTDPGSTGNASNSSEGTGSTSGGSTGDTTGDTTGAIDSTGDMSGGSSTTGPNCMPVQETCNDLDDDCNGIIDDVDVGGDGFCDCLNIALFGNKGGNPSSQFETWLQAQGTQVDRIQTTNTPIDQATLDKYDVIILDRLIRTYTPQEAALINSWVGAGGGLMSMTGYTGAPPDVNNPNSILTTMGLTYNNSKGIINGPVTTWFPHPISMGITSVTFLGGFYINVVDDGIGMNTVVGTLAPGPVAVAQDRKSGKVFVWGDEWIEFDSEWQNQPQIKKFWANILGWLTPQNFCTVPQ